MKKFQFHMQKLLSYKEQMLDSEMMSLAVLNGLLRDAIEKLRQLEEEREKYKEEFEIKMQDHVTSVDYRMYNSYENHIKELIKLCEEEIIEIENQIEEQIEKVKDLKIETKSLETIKENRYEEYKKEEIKKEEIFIDEYISGLRIVQRS